MSTYKEKKTQQGNLLGTLSLPQQQQAMLSTEEGHFVSTQSLEFDCQYDNHDDEEEEKNGEDVDNKDGQLVIGQFGWKAPPWKC